MLVCPFYRRKPRAHRMPTLYRSLLVVAVIGWLGLLVARRAFAPLMMSDDDYRRRRNLWGVLTVAAFLMPNFWAYAVFAAVAIGYAARRDTNPAALFALLLVIVPPLEAAIPVLFKLHHQRVLVLVLLAPMAWRLMKTPQEPGTPKPVADKFLLAFCALQFLLLFPYTSATNSLRQIFLLFVDTWLPYYVMSRIFTRREQLRDAMACFVLTLIIMAPLGIAEQRLGTLLYGDIAFRWNIDGLFGYLTRGDSLRAQLASGQAIVLGYQFAVATGLWLYLQRRIESKAWRWLGVAALALGLVAPISRGPWVGAGAVLAVFALLAPGASRRLVTWSVGGLVAFGIALILPGGEKLIAYLPFVGSAAQESVEYRQEILAVCWRLIQQNPFFGSPFASEQLESLRTGEGIIDIVNTYIAMGLAYGMVGVGLFAGTFAAAMWPLVRIVKNQQLSEDARYMAASLVATLVGVLVTISTVSNYLTIPFIYLMVIGMAVSCGRLLRAELSAPEVMPFELQPQFLAQQRMR